MIKINKVLLIGRLTASPELRYTTNNTAVTSFTLAVNRNFKNETGNYDADFINIVAWNKKAELINEYVTKGDLIGVFGRLQVRSYQNERGENRRVTEVVLEEIEFLKNKPKEETATLHQNNQTLEEKVNSNKPYEDFAREHQEEFSYIDDDDNEMPF